MLKLNIHMKNWGLLSFFSAKPSLYKSAQEINCEDLLKQLKVLYGTNEFKREIDNFHQEGQLEITPLCAALNHNEKKEHILTSVRYLLLFGANPSLNKRFVDGEVCNAPIHEAARNDNFSAIVMLCLSGASIKQSGVNGIAIETLLHRGNHPKEKYAFLTRLEQLRLQFEQHKKAIAKAKLDEQDNLLKVTTAYENLIASWKFCKNEDFLNQFSLEDKNSLFIFIESKVVLLQYELYEFISKQFASITDCSEEIRNQLCELLSDILEYQRIYELPIARESLAADYANLIIAQKDSTVQKQSIEKVNDILSEETPSPCHSLRKRTTITMNSP